MATGGKEMARAAGWALAAVLLAAAAYGGVNGAAASRARVLSLCSVGRGFLGKAVPSAVGRERAPGVDEALGLRELAGLYRSQSRYAEAEPLAGRALELDLKAFGPEHPRVACDLCLQADLCAALGRVSSLPS